MDEIQTAPFQKRTHTEASSKMDVLSSKTISEKDAAKILKKFVDAKGEEENTDLMVRSVCDTRVL